jgi:uncharacterized glyoxalase superfamily protein PhnB
MADNPPVTIWPVLHCDDTEAAWDFLVEVLGFREALIARDESQGIVHAKLRWPAGGTIVFGSTKHLDSVHGQIPRGASAVYVPTGDVDSVHQRALVAGTDIVQPPAHTQFGSGNDAYAFTLRDLQGYLWTFGTPPERHESIGLRPNPAPLRRSGRGRGGDLHTARPRAASPREPGRTGARVHRQARDGVLTFGRHTPVHSNQPTTEHPTNPESARGRTSESEGTATPQDPSLWVRPRRAWSRCCPRRSCSVTHAGGASPPAQPGGIPSSEAR